MDYKFEDLLLMCERVCRLIVGVFIGLLLLALLPACSTAPHTGDSAEYSSNLPCEVITFEDGHLISCKDGSMSWVESMYGWTESVSNPHEISISRGPASNARTDFALEIDPCGDGPGEDELVYKFYDGRFAYYAENGLVIMKPGYYKTDDQQQCSFSIGVDGVLRSHGSRYGRQK